MGLRGLGIINIIILARILVPEDFGLVALATAAQGLLSAMAEFRPDLALIREKNPDGKYYDTVWTLSVIRGFTIALIILCGAHYYAEFFNDSRLVPILYVFAFSAAIEGFQNVGVVDFFKNLELNRQFRFMLVSRILALLITWFVAIVWRNYWALVVGAFVDHALPALLSYRFHKYRPSFSLSAWRSIVGFSSWLMLNNLLTFLNGRVSTFFLGKMTGPAELGQYTLSQRIIYLPGSEIVAPIRQAVFPGYAKVADDLPRLRYGFTKVFGLVLLSVMPLTVALGLVIDPFVRVFVGDKWLSAIPIMQVLVLSAMFRVSTANANPLLLALGRPGQLALINFVALLIVLPLLFWGVDLMGGIGAAWAVAASSLVALLLSVGWALRQLNLGVRALLDVCWRPLAGVGTMVAAVYLADSVFPQIQGIGFSLVRLFVLSIVAGAVYVTAVLLFWRAAGWPRGAEKDFIELLPGRVKKALPSTFVRSMNG